MTVTTIEPAEIQLTDQEFQRVRERLYGMAGIALNDSKRTLVVARLSRSLRTRGLTTFTAFLDHLDNNATEAEANDFVNALTTNLTRFWREDHHFTHLVAYVGELMKARVRQAQKRLRIWSAGCSTGQEPYTIALNLLDAYPDLKRWDFKILATDIDTAVIAKAATAVYPASEISGLDLHRRELFEVLPNGMVRVPPAMATLVSFKVLNLMAPWPMKGPFDAIFCRNVTIYFDRATQSEVFSRMGAMLAPGGFFYIGHSEHMGTGSHGFRLVGKTTYQARAGQPAAPKTRDAA